MSQRDLRVQKTYSALFQAFQALLEEKDFDSITVKELCDRAMVRTATFYNHFSDKYEFLQVMTRETYLLHRQEPLEAPPPEGPAFYVHLFQDALDLLQNNPALVRAIFANSMMWTICSKQRGVVRTEILNHLTQDQDRGYSLAAEPHLLTELIMGSLEQAVRWWLAEKEPCTKEQLLTQLEGYMRRLIT